MSYEENRTRVLAWLAEVCPYGKEPLRFFRFTEHEDGRGTVVFCTGVHSYHISFTDTYLGCTASCRMQRPGETWTRGSDLPDGTFCYATFQRIIHRIVEYELVELAPVPEPQTVEVDVAEPGLPLHGETPAGA